MIEVRNLKKRFGPDDVLRGIDLTVQTGEVLAIIGPSGSGKSTLLRCVNFIEEFDDGEIRIAGEPIGYELRGDVRKRQGEACIARMRTRVGMVFQSFNLFPHCTVLENVVLAPIHIKREPRDKARQFALELLKKVGMDSFADAYPSRLSGGQQQRVAIARTLAMRPQAILLDEVTSALDPELVGEVLAAIRQLASEGMTMMMVTHEIGLAREIAHRIIFLDQGRIVEEGEPGELLDHPSSPRLIAFLQRFRQSGGHKGSDVRARQT